MSWRYIGIALAHHKRFAGIAGKGWTLCIEHLFGAGCIERADVSVRDAERLDVATFGMHLDYDYTDHAHIDRGFAHGFDWVLSIIRLKRRLMRQ